MTAPDPYRPRLVDDDPPGVPPAYPGPGPGDAMAIWEADARESNAQRRIARLAGYVQQLNDRAHEDYLAACQRTVERLQADRSVAVALTARHGLPPDAVPEPVPGQVQNRPRTPVGDGVEPSPPEEFAENDGPPVTLDEAARVLFKVAPGVSRADLQMILQTNTYWAKKLHGTRPGAAQ